MLEYGLQKHLGKLEEIGASAAKEYSLEKALSKMKEDWKDLKFELVPYRCLKRSLYSLYHACYLQLNLHCVILLMNLGSLGYPSFLS